MDVREEIILKKIEGLTFAVYEYSEIDTGIVRYIGIVNNGTLANRHRNHMKSDWYKEANFKLRFVKCDTQSETEAIESHLISLYPPEQLYNKAKVGWGKNKFIPDNLEWENLEVTTEDVIDYLEARITFGKDLYNSYLREPLLQSIHLLKKTLGYEVSNRCFYYL